MDIFKIFLSTLIAAINVGLLACGAYYLFIAVSPWLGALSCGWIVGVGLAYVLGNDQ